jgi:hypothetical protein
MLPPSEVLQAATTVILPSMRNMQNFGECYPVKVHAMYAYNQEDFGFPADDPIPMDVTAEDQCPLSSPSQTSTLVWKNGQLCVEEKSS